MIIRFECFCLISNLDESGDLFVEEQMLVIFEQLVDNEGIIDEEVIFENYYL